MFVSINFFFLYVWKYPHIKNLGITIKKKKGV